MDKYEEDSTACLSLIDSIFKYTILNHEAINTIMWDIQTNDIYNHEKQKVVSEIDYLKQEHEHRCLVIIHNIGKYWERLHKQITMKKRLGLLTNGENASLGSIVSNVKSFIHDESTFDSVIINSCEFDDEYDNRFGGLDNEIIPGYEPTPIPIFSVGGFKIPETFGMFKKARGRPKNNAITTSFTENYRFLTTYTETPEDKLDHERDEQLRKELEASKRGRTIRKVTLKVIPIRNITSAPSAIKVPVLNGSVSNNFSSNVDLKDIKLKPVPRHVRNLDSTAQKVWQVMNAGKQLIHKKLDPLGSSVLPKSVVKPSSAKSVVKSSPAKSVTKSSSAKSVNRQGGGRPMGSPNKPKVIPILPNNFTPRLKSIQGEH